MDITLPVSGFILNLRVTVLLEMQNGFIFEQDQKENFYFAVGGRIKIGESSLESAKRELYEELKVEVHDLKFSTTLENFFEYDGNTYHEISMVYTASTKHIALPKGFRNIPKAELTRYTIKPKCIQAILLSGETPSHMINSEV